MQELNNAGNHDSQVGDHMQFFPTVQIEALSREKDTPEIKDECVY